LLGGEGSRGSASSVVGHPFEDLVAYRLAVEVADELFGVVAGWSVLNQRTIGSQIVRAADSIGANIAEASGVWYGADRRRHLRRARGSLNETEHWLKRAEARGLIEPGLRPKLAEAGRALNGLIKRPAPFPPNASR
jgi:four helix bundle protein